jgi:hypothetical protein
MLPGQDQKIHGVDSVIAAVSRQLNFMPLGDRIQQKTRRAGCSPIAQLSAKRKGRKTGICSIFWQIRVTARGYRGWPPHSEHRDRKLLLQPYAAHCGRRAHRPRAPRADNAPCAGRLHVVGGRWRMPYLPCWAFKNAVCDCPRWFCVTSLHDRRH